MKSEGSLAWSQDPATWPYTEPDEFNPRRHMFLWSQF
jgi:hypothetical protein